MGNPGLVLAISFAELRLEPALFPRQDQDYHYRQDHEPKQNDEAAEEGTKPSQSASTATYIGLRV
jgi:hypothetical protein